MLRNSPLESFLEGTLRNISKRGWEREWWDQSLPSFLLPILILNNFAGWFDYLDVNFHVRRRIGHYVIRIFFPCILCTVVSWLPFWMDRGEIGDRGALGITTLLTEVFLLQYTNDSMPRVSYVKAADLFLIVSFAFTFMALLESVIVYNYKKRFFIAESTQSKSLTGGRTFFRKRAFKVDEVSLSVFVIWNTS